MRLTSSIEEYGNSLVQWRLNYLVVVNCEEQYDSRVMVNKAHTDNKKMNKLKIRRMNITASIVYWI